MPFDIDGARSAGYSDAEIASFLGSQSGFDVDGALKSGYQPSEVVDFLANIKDRGPADETDPLLRVAPTTSGGVNPTFTVSDELTKSVLDKESPRPGEFDMRKASAARNALDDPRATAPRATSGQRPKPDAMLRSGEGYADSSLPVRAVQKARASAAEGGFGVLRAGAEAVGADSVARFAGEAAGAAQGFQQGMGQNKPIAGFGPESPVPYLADMAEGAGSSLLTTAAMASMFGAKAVIPLMSIQSAGQQYDAARQAGKEPWVALTNAVPFGVFEAVGEKFQGMDKAAAAMGVLMRSDAGTAAKKTAADALMRAGVREIPGEVITYGGQTVVDLLPGVGIRQDLTIREFLDGLRDTVIQAGMMGAATAGAGAAARPTAARAPSAEEMARGKGFLVPERDPTPDILAAPTIDAAIAAAEAAVRVPVDVPTAAIGAALNVSGSAVPAAGQAGVASPEAELAVDNIGRILQSQAAAQPVAEPTGGGQAEVAAPAAQNEQQQAVERAGALDTPTAMEMALQRAQITPESVRQAPTTEEAADVSNAVEAPGAVPSGVDGRGADAGGSEPAGGLGDGGRGAAAEPERSGGADVAVGRGAGQPAAVEPQATWFGRRGDGYLTEGDAQMAIPSRQRVSPDLRWAVERMPSGRFRLAGYASAAVKSQDASAQAQATQAAPIDAAPALPDGARTGASDRSPATQASAQGVEQAAPVPAAVGNDRVPANPAVPAVTQTPPPSGVAVSALAESATSGTAAPTERERINAMVQAAKERRQAAATAKQERQQAEMEKARGKTREGPASALAEMVQRRKETTAPDTKRAIGEVVSRYIGKYGKGMGRDAARLEAARLNRKNDGVTYTAEEHNDDALENPYAVVGRRPVQSRDGRPDEARQPSVPEATQEGKDAPQFSLRDQQEDPSIAEVEKIIDKDTPPTEEDIVTIMRIFEARRGGLSLEKAKEVVDGLTAKWKNGPRVHVVASHRDLPVPAPSNARGIYHRGQVYVVAASHRDGAQVRQTVGRTLAHEAVSHYGLRELLGREGWDRLMRQINAAVAAGNKPLKEIQAEIRRLYVDKNGKFNLTADIEADEIAARVVEAAVDENGEFRPGFGFVKAVYAKIAEFLRSIGIEVTFTNAELQGMLVLAQRNLEVGKRTAGGGESMVIAARDDEIARSTTDFSGERRDFIAFDSAQIKSAIGNNGNFDPEDNRVQFSLRSAVAEDAEATAPDLSPWRDATGRLQFAPGVWLYDKLGDLAAPLLTKLGLKAASPELRRQLRTMKLAVQKAQETAAAVAGEAMKLSDAERAMVSDLIEQELAAGTVPPAHAVRLAAMINDSMGAQTDELVRLGMLTKDSAELWRGKYLPRYYKSKLTKQLGDAWADALYQLRGRQKVMAGIKGKHLKGRGLYETVAASAVAEWESLGWEVRDQDHPKADASEISRKILDGEIAPEDTVQVWRDFTREERDKMGEIRDAGFRFVMGYMQTQRDIALGRMFEGLANDPEMSAKRESERFNVQVPDGTVPGTGAKRYGKLAGRWVPKEVMSHLSQIDESQSEAWRMYRKALAIWKEGKTALNPVAHVNNMVSNLTMAHLAGVSYHRADKYIAAARDFATQSPRIKEAKDAGLFLGTMSDAELMNVLPEDLKALVRQQDSAATRIGRTGFNVMTFWLRRPMGWAYQAEDTFFRYLIWKDATDHGMSPEDAVDHAQRYIFAYDDLPKGARMIRDFGIPFFSYTYKAAPALLYSALAHPVRMAAPAAVLWGINAAAYAIAVGDDDDSWERAIRRYLTDAAYREEARKKEKLEREFLPSWNKGTTALGTPKMIRLGMDEVTKLPLFIDVSRIIPGGDLFDVSPNAGGIPLPQPITPSHPLFTTAVAMIGNKDLFRGKELVDKNDTRGEATEKRLDWLWTQVSPAVAAGSYHWDRTMNAIAQASGGEIKWLPEVVADNYTGIGRDGLPVQPKYAAMQTFGIKVRPMDLEKSEAIDRSMQNKMMREIDAEMRSLQRLNNLGAVSDRTYEKARELADTKKDRIREGKTVDGEDKD